MNVSLVPGEILVACILRVGWPFRLVGEETMSEDFPLRARALQSQDVVELLSDKWRIILLHLLPPGPLRAKTLQEAISRISPKVLTQTLRGMERDGLISRKLYPHVLLRVEYRLTEMGAKTTLPLGGGTRGGTRPGTARIRPPEKEIVLGTRSKENQQETKERQTGLGYMTANDTVIS